MKNNDENPEAKSDNEDGAEQNQESSGSWPAMELPDYVIGNNIFADWTNFEKAISSLISVEPAHVPFIKSGIERFFRTTDSALITSLRGAHCQTKRTVGCKAKFPRYSNVSSRGRLRIRKRYNRRRLS